MSPERGPKVPEGHGFFAPTEPHVEKPWQFPTDPRRPHNPGGEGTWWVLLVILVVVVMAGLIGAALIA